MIKFNKYGVEKEKVPICFCKLMLYEKRCYDSQTVTYQVNC